MKPIAATIPESFETNLFALRITELPFFSNEFHFHKECQLVYVLDGEGSRIVGDNVERFGPGDLTFLGSDIPHVWSCDRITSKSINREIHARSVALFFHPHKLVQALSPLIPAHRLETSLMKARRGLKFWGGTKNELKRLLLNLPHEKDFGKLHSILLILNLITSTTEFDFLATDNYVNSCIKNYDKKENERMDKVFKFLFSNFSENVQLEDVAAIADMNKQAFCRYFKSRTQKTMISFVNDLRISHACRLINNGETYISGLSYKCGFNSLSNFNRFFKEIKGVSPREYIKLTTV